MIINLNSKKLRIGMFIDLSGSWIAHPFWKNHFEITSEKQIEDIIKAGIKSVKVDTNKSKIQIKTHQEERTRSLKKEERESPGKAKKEALKINTIEKETDNINQKKDDGIDSKKLSVSDKKHQGNYDSNNSSPSLEWNPEKFLPLDIVNAFKDKSLPPDERVEAVQRYSIELMKNILSNPTTEVISTHKQGISEIVDVVLNEKATAQGLIKIVSYDFYTYTHSVNVGVKAILLAKNLYKNENKHDLHKLGIGFFLHDLGKVNINPNIINKAEKFTKEDMEVMRTHPFEGYKILSKTKQLTEEAWIIVMQHHERYDGKGYPGKLRGEDIHPYARICSLADVYDALTAKRSYKQGKKPIEALKIMYEEMATNFNKELLKKFISLFKEIYIAF